MKRILITGATGNVGLEVIRFLMVAKGPDRIIAGVRDINRAKQLFANFKELEYVHFDFEKPDTFKNALHGSDRIFLLRPPHLSDIEKHFRPFLAAVQKQQIKEIVFLSVQGAEKSKVIPHNKIERLIKEFKLDYVFVRPAYFMQNLSTTLLADIKTKGKIILPAGKAKFNWIDIENIGEVCAILLNRFDDYKNQEHEITGYENANFYTVVQLFNRSISKPIRYESVNPFSFYSIKKREGMVQGMIIVMLLLHFLPRLQKEPKISDFYEKLTGKKPTSLMEFFQREKETFT